MSMNDTNIKFSYEMWLYAFNLAKKIEKIENIDVELDIYENRMLEIYVYKKDKCAFRLVEIYLENNCLTINSNYDSRINIEKQPMEYFSVDNLFYLVQTMISQLIKIREIDLM